MARWSYDGHAKGPFLLLGRLAGMTDEATIAAWTGGERERVVKRVMKTKQANQRLCEDG